MKSTFRRFLIAALSLVMVVSITSDLRAEETTITIVHVNDTHAHLDAFGPKPVSLEGRLGGIAKAASVLGSLRATEPNMVLLHAGDIFTGDFFFNKYFAVPELQLMKELEFDAMAVGNHEFDLKPAGLTYVLAEASKDGPLFPVLSANLDMSEFLALEPFIEQSTIIERDGIKIGIFGMTVPDNPVTMADPVKILPNVGEIAYGTAAALRAGGADLVICLSHLGSLYDKGIAAGVPGVVDDTGIDVIVGGHDHYLFQEPISITNPAGRRTLILQAGEFYKYVGKLTLAVDAATDAVTLKGYEIISLDKKVPQAPEVQAVVDALKPGIVKQYGRVYDKCIGYALFDLEKINPPTRRFRDSAMGNLVTDAFRNKEKTDIAITATGFIAEKIYRGHIVPADVLHSLPYGYDPKSGLGLKLVKLELKGLDIIMGLESTLAYVNLTDDFLMQVSGMKYAYDSSMKVGQRLIIPSISIGGMPIDPEEVYGVAVNEAVVFVLDQMGIKPVSIKPTQDFEYDVLRRYISKFKLVAYTPTGRVRDVSVGDDR